MELEVTKRQSELLASVGPLSVSTTEPTDIVHSSRPPTYLVDELDNEIAGGSLGVGAFSRGHFLALVPLIHEIDEGLSLSLCLCILNGRGVSEGLLEVEEHLAFVE